MMTVGRSRNNGSAVNMFLLVFAGARVARVKAGADAPGRQSV